MFTLTKELPNISVRKRSECGDLELQQMILCRIQVNGVNTARTVKAEGQDIVARGGDCENNIVWSNLEEAGVGAVVFPRKGIYVGVVEAGVLWQGLIVVNTPVMILVPASQ